MKKLLKRYHDIKSTEISATDSETSGMPYKLITSPGLTTYVVPDMNIVDFKLISSETGNWTPQPRNNDIILENADNIFNKLLSSPDLSPSNFNHDFIMLLFITCKYEFLLNREEDDEELNDIHTVIINFIWDTICKPILGYFTVAKRLSFSVEDMDYERKKLLLSTTIETIIYTYYYYTQYIIDDIKKVEEPVMVPVGVEESKGGDGTDYNYLGAFDDITGGSSETSGGDLKPYIRSLQALIDNLHDFNTSNLRNESSLNSINTNLIVKKTRTHLLEQIKSKFISIIEEVGRTLPTDGIYKTMCTEPDIQTRQLQYFCYLCDIISSKIGKTIWNDTVASECADKRHKYLVKQMKNYCEDLELTSNLNEYLLASELERKMFWATTDYTNGSIDPLKIEESDLSKVMKPLRQLILFRKIPNKMYTEMKNYLSGKGDGDVTLAVPGGDVDFENLQLVNPDMYVKFLKKFNKNGLKLIKTGVGKFVLKTVGKIKNKIVKSLKKGSLISHINNLSNIIGKKLNIPKLNVNLGKKMINTQMKLIQNISKNVLELKVPPIITESDVKTLNEIISVDVNDENSYENFYNISTAVLKYTDERVIGILETVFNAYEKDLNLPKYLNKPDKDFRCIIDTSVNRLTQEELKSETSPIKPIRTWVNFIDPSNRGSNIFYPPKKNIIFMK